MRNPDQTRENLLQAAFWEIYRNGFRSASLESILADTGVTKGALYHHFPSKQALGYAIVEEVILPLIYQFWLQPLEGFDDPIDALLAAAAMDEEMFSLACEFGCPLNNLAQEMSPIDEGFRQRLDEIYRLWRDRTAKVLRDGQEKGQVQPDIDPEKAAAFIVAAYEGSVGMAKNAQNPELLKACQEGLEHYIKGLRNPERAES